MSEIELREYECCSPLSYADDEQTIPGRFAGYPPRTRALIDNARVLQSSTEAVANKENGFSISYKMRLGSSPRRGVVWIDVMLTTETDLEVTISPSRVVLQNNITSADVSITVSGLDAIPDNQLLVFTREITSCGKLEDIVASQKTRAPPSITAYISLLVLILDRRSIHARNRRNIGQHVRSARRKAKRKL